MFKQVIPHCQYSNITPRYIEAMYENENVKDKFSYFMAEKNGAKVFTYYHRLNEWCWLDAPVYKEQFKRYRKLIKNKDIVIDIENNGEHLINDIKWYSLCLQRWDKEENDYGEMSLCKGSIELFGHLIHGYVYYFEKKADRDNAYNWLVK